MILKTANTLASKPNLRHTYVADVCQGENCKTLKQTEMLRALRGGGKGNPVGRGVRSTNGPALLIVCISSTRCNVMPEDDCCAKYMSCVSCF